MLALGKMLLLAASLFALTVAPTRAADTRLASTAVTVTQSAAVSIANNGFAPAEITVVAGTLVEWVNEEYASGEWHDVIAEDGSFVSDIFGPGESFTVTFWTPGAYVDYCDLHEGMFGTVVVE